MSKNTTLSFCKGAIVGTVAGMALLTAGKMMVKQNHNISKGSAKAMRAVGELVDAVQTMFK